MCYKLIMLYWDILKRNYKRTTIYGHFLIFSFKFYNKHNLEPQHDHIISKSAFITMFYYKGTTLYIYDTIEVKKVNLIVLT